MAGKSCNKLVGFLTSLLVVASLVACGKSLPAAPPNSQSVAQSDNSSRSGSPAQRPGSLPPGSTGRGAGTASGTPRSILVPVITAAGSISPAVYANLYFGSGGRIEKIAVALGDRVPKGTVLAKLDTTSLEVSLAQARVAWQQALSAQIQAKINLETARFTLDKTKLVSDFKDEITDLQWEIRVAKMGMEESPGVSNWNQQIATSEKKLADKTKYLEALMGRTQDTDALAYVAEAYDDVTIKDIRAKRIQVDLAQQTLDKSQGAVEQSRKSLALAQQQLDQATITAPFSGIVAALNYYAGDFVPTGATQKPIVYLIDPGTMGVDVNLNELDVPKVEPGQTVSISIDAFPGVKLDGKVLGISPSPMVQGRMVGYNTRVALSVPRNMRIKPGMNAVAQIVRGESVNTTQPNPPRTAQSGNTTRPGAPTSSAPAQLVNNPTGLSSTNSSTAAPRVANAASTNAAASISGYGTISAGMGASLNFGTGGRIQKISSKEGERASRGAVLAKLDTSNLEAALAQARLALEQAELARTQAEANLETAQSTLDKTNAISGIKREIIDLQWQTKVVQMRMQQADNNSFSALFDRLVATVRSFKADIAAKNKSLSVLLGQPEYAGLLSYDILGEKYDTLTTINTKMRELQVELARQTLDKSRDAVDQAEKSLALAQQQMNQAAIVAPFDGIVASLGYNEGDIISAPAQNQRPVIYFIDPAAAMELNIAINELDINTVEIGQRASIAIDAFPEVKLPGKVTAISLVPVVRGGIADYTVTVAFSVPPNMKAKIGAGANARIMLK